MKLYYFFFLVFDVFLFFSPDSGQKCKVVCSVTGVLFVQLVVCSVAESERKSYCFGSLNPYFLLTFSFNAFRYFVDLEIPDFPAAL